MNWELDYETKLGRTWAYMGDSEIDRGLPPDLIARWRYTWPATGRPYPTICGERWSRHWHCTRMPHHTGRHAAGDGSVIRAVW